MQIAAISVLCNVRKLRAGRVLHVISGVLDKWGSTSAIAMDQGGAQL